MEGYPPWHREKGVRVNCEDCTAECCKHVAIQVDEPTTLDDFQAFADYVQYTDVVVYQDHEDDWLVEFKTRCGQLQGNRCMAFRYGKQPQTCTEYEVKTCVMNEHDHYWKELFISPDDVQAYVRKLGLGAIRTERMKACDLECCNHLSIPIDEPKKWRDFDDIRWYVAHRNVSVVQDQDGDWLVTFDTLPKEQCARCNSDACEGDVNDHKVAFPDMDSVDRFLTEQRIAPPRLTAI